MTNKLFDRQFKVSEPTNHDPRDDGACFLSALSLEEKADDNIVMANPRVSV